LSSDDEDPASKHNVFHIDELSSDNFADIGIEFPENSVNLDQQRAQIFRIPTLFKDSEYLELVTKLNIKQKRLLLDIVNKVKTRPDVQELLFVSGAARVGKSVLITALTQTLLRYWVHDIRKNPEQGRRTMLRTGGDG